MEVVSNLHCLHFLSTTFLSSHMKLLSLFLCTLQSSVSDLFNSKIVLAQIIIVTSLLFQDAAITFPIVRMLTNRVDFIITITSLTFLGSKALKHSELSWAVVTSYFIYFLHHDGGKAHVCSCFLKNKWLREKIWKKRRKSWSTVLHLMIVYRRASFRHWKLFHDEQHIPQYSEELVYNLKWINSSSRKPV